MKHLLRCVRVTNLIHICLQYLYFVNIKTLNILLSASNNMFMPYSFCEAISALTKQINLYEVNTFQPFSTRN